MTRYQIDFEPIGKRLTAGRGQSLLVIAQDAGIALAAVCGGVGTCGACKVRLVAGQLSPVTPAEQSVFTPEELAAGWRLGCRAFPQSDLKIEIPPESLTATQRLQLEGASQAVTLSPAVTVHPLTLAPPDLTDLRADWMTRP
jgi:uncharacterized 2Fe-2S/4Fe-4S cluster protein (DUF4445 family)